MCVCWWWWWWSFVFPPSPVPSACVIALEGATWHVENLGIPLISRLTEWLQQPTTRFKDVLSVEKISSIIFFQLFRWCWPAAAAQLRYVAAFSPRLRDCQLNTFWLASKFCPPSFRVGGFVYFLLEGNSSILSVCLCACACACVCVCSTVCCGRFSWSWHHLTLFFTAPTYLLSCRCVILPR